MIYLIDIDRKTVLKERLCGNMPDERSCGAIIFTHENGIRKYLLIHEKYSGEYGFPKGHTENGETERETAIREVKEETGLDIILQDDFCFVYEHYLAREGRPNDKKRNILFLAEYKEKRFRLQEEEIDDIILTDFENATELLQSDALKRALNEAEKYLMSLL